MTFQDALAQAAAGLDVAIARAHERFEQSLIDHQCPAELLQEMRDFEREHLQERRARTLSAIRERLLRESRAASTVH